MATMQHVGSAPDPEVPEWARNRTFSPRYKLDILNQYESLNKQGKGALLRREGLYTSLISELRKQRTRAPWRRSRRREGGRRRTRWSGRTSGCAGRTSGCSASWPRRAR